MAFTRDWDESNPTDNTVANQIDEYNRYLRVDTADRLEDMFYGFTAGENTLSQHAKFLQFYEQASVAQPSAGYGRLYCKAVGGKCEMFWQDEDGDEIQLTYGGAFVGGYGATSQMIMWNTTEEDTDGGRESKIIAKGEQSGGEVTTLGYIEISHDGTSDDQKGQIKLVVNDGDDDDAPSKVGVLVNSDGTVTFAQEVTIADSSQLATSAAPTADADIANKKYVDDQMAMAAIGALSGASVFSTTMTAASTWQDLDLSATIGANAALIFLEVAASTTGTYAAKPKGHGSSTFARHWDSNGYDYGCCQFKSEGTDEVGYITLMTDSSGVIQHGASNNTTSWAVTLIGYIKFG